MSHARHPDRASSPARLSVALLSAVLLFAAVSLSSPADVLGSTTTMAAVCDYVNLRAKPSTSATIKAKIKGGTKVTVVGKVSGGSWKTTCAGKSVSGSNWYKISAVSGKSVSSLYGVSYVYGASGLFKTVSTTSMTPTTIAAVCDYVNLRAKPSTNATIKAKIKAGTQVTAVAKVSGGSWKTLCAGKSVSGSSWYKISAVSGKSVSSLYGVNYVYGASGLFKTVTTATTSPTPTSDSTLTEGIDVSVWQGKIDWTRVAAAGKRFAIIRASAGSLTVDSTYATNRARAKTAGLYVGAYHFANPDSASNDALNEANLFLSVATPTLGEIVPALDLEVTNGLSTTALQRWVTTWLERVTTVVGVKPMIYTSPAFWRTYMGDTASYTNAGYKILWIAHWGVSQPSIPAQNWGGNSWTFWQYTSDGSVPGISGRVDLDRYKGSDFSRVLIK